MTKHEKIECLINNEMAMKDMTGLEKLAYDFRQAKEKNKHYLIEKICHAITDGHVDDNGILKIKQIIENRLQELAGDNYVRN